MNLVTFKLIKTPKYNLISKSSNNTKRNHHKRNPSLPKQPIKQQASLPTFDTNHDQSFDFYSPKKSVQFLSVSEHNKPKMQRSQSGLLLKQKHRKIQQNEEKKKKNRDISLPKINKTAYEKFKDEILNKKVYHINKKFSHVIDGMKQNNNIALDKNFDLVNYQKRIVSLFASNVSYTNLSKLRKNLQIIRKGTRRDDISSIVEKTLAQKKLEIIRENIERICSNKRKNFL